MGNKSDVERYWDSIRAKWPTPQPDWNQLDPNRQQQIMHSINLMLAALQ